MKKVSKLFILATLLLGMYAPAWGQASTVGKEFWVSSTLVCSPNKAAVTPYIAISAEKACTVTIKGGLNGNINITQDIAAGSWNEFGHNEKTAQTNPKAGPVFVNMTRSEWYPDNITNAGAVNGLAGQTKKYGLHITATEEISVYVILSSPASMDASNILPMTALQSEYYTQDYTPEANEFSDLYSTIAILGTENGTKVDITPKTKTADNKPAGQTYQITINQGDVYYVVSSSGQSLAGTHIVAKDEKKIAVYNGLALGRIPNGISARDCLFEQAMPVDYWGNEFVVTRSKERDGNLIGITAMEEGTSISIDGYEQTVIGKGETYYILLQSAFNPYTKNLSKITGNIDQVMIADAIYLQTSCPCAVYSYDTGNAFKNSVTETEEVTIGGKDDYLGDPSSVWVSPLQQRIGQITFGICYTDLTKDHFINIVTETATCQKTTLTLLYGATKTDKTSDIVWIPVPGNPAYSYSRTKIGIAATEKYNVFQLNNPHGVIAYIYGNGDDESYAYSAGSAAVKRGVNLDGITFTEGMRNEDHKYCAGESVEFDAQVGNDVIDKVDWDFGDGTSTKNGTPQTKHTYYSPGWYDVSANIYAHKECPETTYPAELVSFTFYVNRPDTAFIDGGHVCLAPDDPEPQVWVDTVAVGDPTDCTADTIKFQIRQYGRDSLRTDEITGRDSIKVRGKWYYESTSIEYAEDNKMGCTTTVTLNIHVQKCITIDIVEDYIKDGNRIIQYCADDLDAGKGITFKVTNGDIMTLGKAFLYYKQNGTEKSIELQQSDNQFLIPSITTFKAGDYEAYISYEDTASVCQGIKSTGHFHLQLNYPKSVFEFLFGNTLAVLNKSHNGGYDFVKFQWYKDGEAIKGATSATYYWSEESTFPQGEYYVELTTSDGVTMPSCPRILPDANAQSAPQQTTPTNSAKKVMVDQHLYLQKDGVVYDMFGHRIQ